MSLKRVFKPVNILAAIVIYPLGDAIAQLITGHYSLERSLLMMLMGLYYSFEIPLVFAEMRAHFEGVWTRTWLCVLYFNPVWIARHVLPIVVLQMWRLSTPFSGCA